jgi:hypothetical protein
MDRSEVIIVTSGRLKDAVRETVDTVVGELCTDRFMEVCGDVIERIVHDIHVDIDEFARETEEAPPGSSLSSILLKDG